MKQLYCTLFVLIALFTAPRAYAQDLAKMEDSLVVTADSMHHAFIPEMRQLYCEKFIKQLVRTLKTPNSFNYPFTKLGATINILQPEDKKFKMYNWAVNVAGATIRYYGAVQMQGDQLKLYPLIDYSQELGSGLEDSILTNGKWYGGIYYDILSREYNGKTIYSFLGKNINNLLSNIKVIDPMSFSENGLIFGAPVFSIPGKKGTINRFVLEYRKDVSVSMKWDKDYNAIIYDRLISQMNDPNRKNTFVPTGQYDGLKWENGKWTLLEDALPVQIFKDGEAPVPKPTVPKQ